MTTTTNYILFSPHKQNCHRIFAYLKDMNSNPYMCIFLKTVESVTFYLVQNGSGSALLPTWQLPDSYGGLKHHGKRRSSSKAVSSGRECAPRHRDSDAHLILCIYSEDSDMSARSTDGQIAALL